MSAKIRAGRLKHQLFIQETTKVRGNPGTWANIATNPGLRCDITNAGGAEKNASAGQIGERKIIVTCRWRSDISYQHRLHDGGTRYFDIEHIDNVDELNHKLILTVVERTIQNG